MRPTGTAEELERRRRRAVALLDQGRGVREVAGMVGASPAAVTRWRQAYEKRGEAGLCAKPHPGRTPKLSLKQRRKLIRLLKRGPGKHGYRTELWTLKRVAEVIRKQFGVRYDPSGVWHVLRGMDWSCQKPERRARERDEKAIERWRKKDWPRIKKRPKKRA
jgi:transposase